MVLAVAVLADRLASFPFEVDRRGIEEHQLQGGEQIPGLGEKSLFDQVLHTARREGRGAGLLPFRQRLAQPSHGAVEVVQLQPFGSGDGVTFPPDFGGAVTAGSEQPVQHRQEDRPLHVEAELALGQQPAENLRQPQLLPQALKHQRRTDPHLPRRRNAPLTMRAEHRRMLGKAGAGGQQGVELAGLSQHIEPPQGGDDVLLHTSVVPLVVDDLEILVLAGPFAADEHGGLLIATTIIASVPQNTRGIY